jgi:PhzF family phenazine biosynthesis protein
MAPHRYNRGTSRIRSGRLSGSVRVFQVDAFTSRPYSGNPAGVVLDADALSEADMRAIAREINAGDTAFVLGADASDHDLRLRFFTPRGEAAFVGHATLAAHAVLASLPGASAGSRRQRSAGGLVDVDIISAQPVRIAIHQPPPAPGRALGGEALDAVVLALGLRREDLCVRCPAMIAGQRSARLLLGVKDAQVLERAQPDAPRLTALSAQLGAPGYFLFTLEPSAPDVYTEARMFCPALGIAEDPVSGNAHALLGAHLLQLGLLGAPDAAPVAGTQIVEFTGAQGRFVDRPGRVTVALGLQDDVLCAVSIIGEAVIVFAGALVDGAAPAPPARPL